MTALNLEVGKSYVCRDGVIAEKAPATLSQLRAFIREVFAEEVGRRQQPANSEPKAVPPTDRHSRNLAAAELALKTGRKLQYRRFGGDWGDSLSHSLDAPELDENSQAVCDDCDHFGKLGDMK